MLKADFDIEESEVVVIDTTKAGNCMIEFSTEDVMNKIALKDATSYQDSAKFTPLNSSDLNNYVIIKGITRDSLSHKDHSADISKAGIISLDDDQNPNKNSHVPPNEVSALMKDKASAMELVKHGLLLSTDKVRYRVYYAKPRIKVTVCYRCAGFNQHSKN